MSDEMQKMSEDLIVAHAEYRELAAAVVAQNPELFAQFSEAREKCENLESGLKALYRTNPSTNLDVSPEHKFRVSTSTKADLDLESTVIQAEGYGHIELLLEYGVLQFKGDPSRIERLPEELKPVYKKFVTSKSSVRVSAPKAFKRSW